MCKVEDNDDLIKNGILTAEQEAMLSEALAEPVTLHSVDAAASRTNWGEGGFEGYLRKTRAHITEVKVAAYKWPKRPSKPRKMAKTDAERSQEYRKRKLAAKMAAAPRLDRVVLNQEALCRKDLLLHRLKDSPLPPKLKHLRGREEELAMAWMARELIQEPECRGRLGGPRGIGRIAEIFGALVSPSEQKPNSDIMRRKLKHVSYLEEIGVWPTPAKTGDKCSF